MQVPHTITPLTTLGPISGVDTTLHQFVGVSWHVLMPYTVLGGGLMLYSQTRLMRGQHAMAKATKATTSKKKRTPRRKQSGWTVTVVTPEPSLS
ncbi:MAG TPA: hypothetical protein VMR95_04115 [Candidatus Binatia bacterium]|nr:hypothetical protein [Candidatus Binatia bacterium]